MKHEPVTSKPSSETQGQLVGATGFLRAKVFAPTSCPWVSEDASKLEKAKKASQLIYKVLVEKNKRDLHFPRVKKNGGRIVTVPTEINWKAAYLLTRQCTNSSRLME